MMHAQVVGVAPKAPTFIGAVVSGSGNQRRYTISWTDNSMNETAFVIERASTASGPWTELVTIPSDRSTVGPGTGTRTYVDRTRSTFVYRVYALNVVGDTWNYADPALNTIQLGGFPTLTLSSNGDSFTSIAGPSGLAATQVAKNRKSADVTLTWSDNSTIETGFLVQRAENSLFTVGVTNATVAGNTTTFTQAVSRGKTYYYRVHAFNDTRASDWSNTATIVVP